MSVCMSPRHEIYFEASHWPIDDMFSSQASHWPPTFEVASVTRSQRVPDLTRSGLDEVQIGRVRSDTFWI